MFELTKEFGGESLPMECVLRMLERRSDADMGTPVRSSQRADFDVITLTNQHAVLYQQIYGRGVSVVLLFVQDVLEKETSHCKRQQHCLVDGSVLRQVENGHSDPEKVELGVNPAHLRYTLTSECHL